MTTTAEKTVKPAHVARKATEGTFFRKQSDEGFFSGTNFFGGNSIQPKLSISKPDDAYEQEADSVADQVMRMPDTAVQPSAKQEEVQRKEEENEEQVQPKLMAPHISAIQCKEEDDGTVQPMLMRKVLQRSEDEYSSNSMFASFDATDHTINRKEDHTSTAVMLQRSGRDPPGRSPPIEQHLNSSKGGGSPMPDSTRSFMESRFQADFSCVRIHTGSAAESMSSSIHAQAFTHGNDIYFNSGKYSPNTASGGLLLAHELTHTIQQGASHKASANTVSRKPMIQRAAQDRPVPSQLTNAVAKAKSMEGKVNANTEGADGYRTGWEHLLDYFKTTMGEDKVIRAGGASVQGAVSEEHIKKKSNIEGMPPKYPARAAGQGPYIRDAMPSWCGIFVFWALNKSGVPMKKWELGGRNITPDAAYPPGYVPKAGDIAYRNNFSHFAIVEKADSSTVTSVNGNTAGEDNLGGQVQTRDHPMSDWTAFFDPLLLKDGELRSGEAVVEEKPKSLRELRRELFNVSRKAETWPEEEAEEQVQAKPELSNWHVGESGSLQHVAPPSTETNEEKIQAKEEEQEEEIAGSVKDPGIQKKEAACHEGAEAAYCEANSGNYAINRYAEDETSSYSNDTYDSTIQRQEEQEQDRGPPPVQLKVQSGTIQCGWFDDAVSFVNSAIDYVAEGLAAGKRLILNEARDFVMAIPGYRALRVVLGEDPITGEEIERNGHTFIEAAFDIMPGGRLLHEKLTELGALEEAASWIDRQIATVESIVHNVVSRVETFWNNISLEDLASPMQIFEDAGSIIYDTISSIIEFAETAATELLETVKRFLLEQIVNFIKEHTTAYPLLTVILEQDPITEEHVERNGTNILNALLELGGAEGIEQRRQMQETGTFKKVADWIDRAIAVFSSAYQQIRQGFSNIWDIISIESLMHPIDTFNQIYDQFAAPVRQVWDFVSETATIILNFIKEVLMRRLSEWARTVRGYHLVTVIIGKDPFTDERVPRTVENVIRGFMGLMDGGEEQFQQLKESGAIDRTMQRIYAAVDRLNMTPAAIVQLFIDLWNSFSINDLTDPIAAFRRILATFGEPIERLFNFIVEIVKIVIEVIMQIMNFPIDLINNIIAKAMQAFDRIKRDPVGFLKNLLRAIKQGFIQFFDNIGTHLLNGLTGWLMSELRDAGVPTLTDFSLRGVIAWVLEVLGISMERIWQKLAEHPRIGPARVARIRSVINTLEGIWTFIKDVQERGMAAIWEKIQEQLSNLWNTILDAVKNWVMERIINQVVTRLLSMLDPTGIMAVVNSAIAIYNAVQSFIRYLREMLEVINSFVEGVAEIAAGNVTTAANFLERTMGRAMPIVVGFLANQVGLSGIGRRIGEMITRVRQMVDEALTWLVNRAVNTGMNIIDRIMAMGRSAAGAIMGWLGLRQPFTAENGESHQLYFRGSGANAVLTVASNPTPFETFISGVQIPPTDPQAGLKEHHKAAAVQKARQIDTLKGAPGMSENDKNRQMGQLLQSLSENTRYLFGGDLPMCGQAEHNPSGDSNSMFGHYMRIKPLTRRGLSIHSGSDPTESSHNIYRRLHNRKQGDRTYYRKGHLLNQSLGGPGGWRNLTPLSQAGNSAHEGTVESMVKAAVDSGAIVEYRVVANYRARSDKAALLAQTTDPGIIDIIEAEDNVPESLTCDAYRLDSRLERVQPIIPPSTRVPNPIDRTIAAYGLGGVATKINLNTGTRSDLLRLPSLGPTKVDAIIAFRAVPTNVLPSGKFFDSVDNLSRVAGIGATAIANIRGDTNVEV